MSRTTTALLTALLVAGLLPSGLAAAQDGTGAITGRVTAAEGAAALDDVCVAALELTGSAARAETRTAGDGTYELAGLEPGYYVVLANSCDDPRDGFVPALHGSDPEEVEAGVVVEAGATQGDVDVRLARAGTITGRVTEDGTGAALEDVCVRAVTDESVLASGTRTAADGSYRLTTAEPGENQVIFVDCDGPRFHTPELYDDEPLWPLSDEEVLGERVAVTAGGLVPDVDASLAVGGTIEGTVTLAHTGEPSPFQAVGAWAEDDRDDLPTALALSGIPVLGLVSDVFVPAVDGTFDLAGLPAGDYTLELSPGFLDGDVPTDLWRERWYQRAETRTEAEVVTVRAGEALTGLELELVPTPSTRFLCEGTETTYPDVPPSNVHAEPIGCMTDFGVIAGGADGRYRPGAAVRRDQMASFVARVLRNALPAEDLPTPAPDAFGDDDGNVHEENIDLLAALGVVEGDGSGNYRPTDVVGRGQMASFLARAYELATGATLRTPATSFADVEGTRHAASIRKVAVAAIAAGTSSTSYEPNAAVRRDQMASFVARLQLRLFVDGAGFVAVSSDSTTPAAARHATGLGW